MKKIFVVLAVASVLTFNYSCKKQADATTDAVENAADATGDALNNAGDAVVDAGTDAVSAAKDALGLAEVPTFENADLQTWAQDLITTASDLKTAAASGDEAAKNDAQTKIADLAGKLAAFKDSPEFAKAQKLYTDVSTALSAE